MNIRKGMKETEKSATLKEPKLIYPLVFWEEADKKRVLEMVKRWKDIAIGYFDANRNQQVITLYAGENDHREPVAFIFEDNNVLKVIVTGKTPATAEKHFRTVADKDNLNLDPDKYL